MEYIEFVLQIIQNIIVVTINAGFLIGKGSRQSMQTAVDTFKVEVLRVATDFWIPVADTVDQREVVVRIPVWFQGYPQQTEVFGFNWKK